MNNNNEYKTCPDCCYDILDDEGDVMDHECISDNEMIAEFMSAEYTGTRVKDYDTSWDWLMPVVHKIDEKCRERLGLNHSLHIGDDIDAVYHEVVEFIKEVNELTK